VAKFALLFLGMIAMKAAVIYKHGGLDHPEDLRIGLPVVGIWRLIFLQY
jgi:hypothetical protein